MSSKDRARGRISVYTLVILRAWDAYSAAAKILLLWVCGNCGETILQFRICKLMWWVGYICDGIYSDPSLSLRIICVLREELRKVCLQGIYGQGLLLQVGQGVFNCSKTSHVLEYMQMGKG